ncbi:MAG TPA: class I SAM-dependent methyltransferase [Candidatus Krumholzibacteria bacterium]
MHASVLAFVKRNAARIHAPVLEVGSCNVNGSVRSFCQEPYTGIDIVSGPGVDQVVAEGPLPFEDESFQTVISTEMLEHALDPVSSLREMVRVLKPGGVLLVTARGNGFFHHNPPDRWRVMPGTLREWSERLGLEAEEEADPEVSGQFLIAEKK